MPVPYDFSHDSVAHKRILPQLLFSLGLLCLLMLSSVAAAQSPDAASLQAIFGPYTPEFVREKVQQNLIVAHRDQSPWLIPRPVLYQTVFLQLLRNQSDSHPLFSPAEWELIRELPAHDDPQLAAPHRARLHAFCEELRADSAVASIPRLALRADDIERQRTAELEEHYQKVLSRLSGKMAERIEAQIEALLQTRQITHTRVDLPGLSAEVPEYVGNTLRQTCSAFRVQAQQNPGGSEQRKRLRDTSTSWRPWSPDKQEGEQQGSGQQGGSQR